MKTERSPPRYLFCPCSLLLPHACRCCRYERLDMSEAGYYAKGAAKDEAHSLQRVRAPSPDEFELNRDS